MKRFSFVIFALITVLFITGCDTDISSTGDYYYEIFSVSLSYYDSVLQPKVVNFSSIKNYSDELKLNKLDFESGTDLTESQLRNTLKDGGLKTSDVNAYISSLNQEGNICIIFYHKYDTNKRVVLYVEKL